MKTWRKLILILVVLSCCVGCDQITKEVAKQTLQKAAPVSWFYDTVRFHYTENTGAFLSLGATLSDNVRFWIFLVLPGIALWGMMIFGVLSSQINQRELFMLSLVVGGGASNLIDRIVQDGRVPDFLNIGVGTLRTGVFNVADVLIMLGVGGLLIFGVSVHKERRTTHNESRCP
jgi:signal peptidase II